MVRCYTYLKAYFLLIWRTAEKEEKLIIKKDGFGSQPFSRLQYYFCLRVVQMKQMGTEINVILQRKGRQFWRMENLFLQHQVNFIRLVTWMEIRCPALIST